MWLLRCALLESQQSFHVTLHLDDEKTNLFEGRPEVCHPRNAYPEDLNKLEKLRCRARAIIAE